MIHNAAKVFTFAILLCLTAGCLPYQSNFTCAQMEDGKCVSVETAYKDALNNGGVNEGAGAPALSSNEPRNAYRDALFDRFAGLLREPETPVIVPPKTMRVLMLPYRGKSNELFMPRYAYVLIGESSWILAKEAKTTEED